MNAGVPTNVKQERDLPNVGMQEVCRNERYRAKEVTDRQVLGVLRKR